MSQVADQHTARARALSSDASRSTTVRRDVGSSRTFAYVRSSSLTSSRSGCFRPTSSGTSVRSPAMSVSIRPTRVRVPCGSVPYRPTAIRCARSVGWSGAALCRTAKEVMVPLSSSVDLRLQGVHPGGLQPLRRPVRQIPPGRRVQGGQQVGERGVAVRVPLEVLAAAGEELLLTDEGDQLDQHRGALGVGDAVEVLLDGLEVDHVGRDRVGRGQLILPVRPGLEPVRERGPGRLRVVDDLAEGEVGRPGGEGLLQPQVVPPAHRHQVAEPHVGELVQDRVVADLVRGGGRPAAEHVLVAQGDAADVLHRAAVVLGDEHLVVLAERVRLREVAFEDAEARLGDVEDPVGVQVVGQRPATVQGRGHVAAGGVQGVVDARVVTGDQRREVGRDRLGLREARTGRCRRRRVRPRAGRRC